jgi:hypothetical protein
MLTHNRIFLTEDHDVYFGVGAITLLA